MPAAAWLPVWLLAAALGALAYAAGHLLPGSSPASRLVRGHGAPPPAGARALGHLRHVSAAIRRRLLGWLRRRAMERAFPDLLAHLSLQAGAGAGVLEAFATAPLAVPEPLRSELVTLAADLQVAPLPPALARWAARVGIPAAAGLAETLTHQQRLGFPLAAALAREEAHCLSLLRQQARRRIQATAALLAAVTAVLLFNTLVLYFLPAIYSLPGLSRP